MQDETSYVALALQFRCDAVNGCADSGAARERMARSIERLRRELAASRAFIGDRLRLVVLPEYFLTGYPAGEKAEEWIARAVLEPGGRELRELGRVARETGVFLAGNAYESDPHFPGLFFQSSFVLDDAGERVLGAHRLISLYTATPLGVWDRYLEHYGAEHLFPVAETALGRLAAVASEEILYPEVARCLALRGAEVLLHSSSETGSPQATPKKIARRARAIENMAYVVSANSGGIAGGDIPQASTDGGSAVIDDRGLVLAEAGPGESMVANAEVDLAALRRRRRTPGMGNLLARQQPAFFAAEMARAPHGRLNELLDDSGRVAAPSRREQLSAQGQVIERLIRAGRL